MNKSWDRINLFLLAAWCILLTLLVYGVSLQLPFFFDDFVHYPYVEGHTFGQIWTTTDELAYYRPLNFALWRITYTLFGAHNRVVDHGINLLLHAANGFLTGLLAMRLWQFPQQSQSDWRRGYLAAALYLFFPFSYQVVPWVGSLSHLLVTFLILSSLITFWQMRQTGHLSWGILSLVCSTLALFTHENGILVLPFIVLIELTTPNQKIPIRRLLMRTVIWAMPILFWLPLRWMIYQGLGGDFFPNNLEGLLQNSAYFIQGAAYPLTSIGGWLHRRFGFNDLVTIASLSGLIFMAAAIVQRQTNANRRAWLPWLWWIVASLPAVLLLKVLYVINGPRLLMVASVGSAWLWTDFLLRLTHFGKKRARWGAGVVLAALLTLVLVGQNWQFIRVRMRLHQILGANFDEIVTATQAVNAAGQTAVFINAPSWLAPQDTTFALGHEGVQFWPDYVPEQSLVSVHTGQPADLKFARIDAIRPDIPIHYGVSGGAPDWKALAEIPAQLFTAQYETDAVTMQQVGIIQPDMIDEGEPLAIFAPETEFRVLLHDVKLHPIDDGIEVHMVWSVTGPHPDATVFLHLVDDKGQIISQADGWPAAGSYPFSLWTAETQVEDIRQVISVVQPAAVRVGLYSFITGERQTAVSGSGEPLKDNAVTIQVE